jgi:endonuclease/exonuclease/phosphatase (EEP) superfamily protein YafD
MKPIVSFSRRSAELESSLAHEIEREPYTFVGELPDTDPVRFISFHAVPSGKGPEAELAALARLPAVRDGTRIVIAGDFNVTSEVTDAAFVPLGYVGHIHEKTTLKKTPDQHGVYTHRQYDHIYTKGVTVCASGTLNFVD